VFFNRIKAHLRIRIGAFAVAFATWVCKGSSRCNSQKIDSFIHSSRKWVEMEWVDIPVVPLAVVIYLWIYTMLPVWYSTLSPFPSYLRKALRPTHHHTRGIHWGLSRKWIDSLGLVSLFLALFSSCPAWIHKVREVKWYLPSKLV